jgi:hypothetical protein
MKLFVFTAIDGNDTPRKLSRPLKQPPSVAPAA